MEDEKLAEYYDDLTRRGGGAARFKQGLGFSGGGESTHDGPPPRGSALPTSSSFLSSFVKASDISKTSELEKQAQIQSIQNKLSKKSKERSNSSRRSRSRSRDRDRDIKRIRRSRSRERGSMYRSCSRERRSRRSRSREIGSRNSRYQSRSRSRDRDRERARRKRSPEEIRNKGKTPSGNAVDYAKSIEGYDSMTPAQRVKAKMKLQLSETAEHDKTLGKGAGWERFEFNKDAPLDDEEIEAAEDDAAVVKNMGQSFRFSAVEAKREQEIKNVHDEAIFGGALFPLPTEVKEDAESYPHSHRDDNDAKSSISSLLSNQIVTMQQKGSWRDRVGKS